MHYHKRINILKHTVKKGEKKFFIINAWHQIEGKKENILGPKEYKTGRGSYKKLPKSLEQKSNILR